MTDPISTAAVVSNAAKAGASALAKRQAHNHRVNEELLEAARGTPEFEQAVKAYGKRQAVKQTLMTGLLESMVQRLHIGSDYLKNGLYKDLAEKTAEIPEDSLQPPAPSVAMPVLQSLGFSHDEPDLKDMYLNLLATASDSRRAAAAHPSFAEFIRQLSAEEASLLRDILGHKVVPVARIVSEKRDDPSGGSVLIVNHMIDWRADDNPSEPDVLPFGATYVDNWVRLGIVNVAYDQFLTSGDPYAWMEHRPELALAKTMHENEHRVVSCEKGAMVRTNLGEQFARVVIGLDA